VHPDTWRVNYTYGFASRVIERMNEAEERRETSTALVVRDITDQAREAMWDEFPDLRPHPVDCDCSICRRSRKPVQARHAGRQYLHAAMEAGRSAGNNARIMSRQTIGERKSLG